MPRYPGEFPPASPASSRQAWSSLPKEALAWRSFQFSRANPRHLLLGIQRMFALLKKLVLQFQAGIIRFHRPNRLADRCNPQLHVRLAKLLHRQPAVARVMIGKFRIPPNAG